MKKLTFKQLQNEHKPWHEKNFGSGKPYQMLMGIVEEVGELAHAQLKMEQNIRGSELEHLEKAMDAVGDIAVFLAGYCNAMEFDFQRIIEKVWSEVRKRDYSKLRQTDRTPK